MLNVLGLATDNQWQVSNWVNSCKSNNCIPNIVGMGEQFKGWKWRTEKYLEFLDSRKNDEIILIMDVYDTLVVKDAKIILKKFKMMNSNVVISVEECFVFTAEHLKNIGRPITYEEYKSMNKTFSKYNHISINAGLMMGYCKSLKKLLRENLIFMNEILDDDQTGIWNMFLDYLQRKRHDIVFKLDFKQKLFTTVSDVSNTNQWEWDIDRKAWKYKHTNSYPTCFHFSGKNYPEYIRMGSKLYPNFYTHGFIKN